MSKCRYDLKKECHGKDCVDCVIEDIKAEIKDLRMSEGYWQFDRGLMKALEIIDQHMIGEEQESEDKA